MADYKRRRGEPHRTWVSRSEGGEIRRFFNGHVEARTRRGRRR
jgi:hypothetical protein